MIWSIRDIKINRIATQHENEFQRIYVVISIFPFFSLSGKLAVDKVFINFICRIQLYLTKVLQMRSTSNSLIDFILSTNLTSNKKQSDASGISHVLTTFPGHILEISKRVNQGFTTTPTLTLSKLKPKNLLPLKNE